MNNSATSPFVTPEQFAELQQEFADPHSPMIGVHMLGEAIFCGRAALLTCDQQNEDLGLEESDLPDLGGLPVHDVDRIQSKLDSLWKELKLWPVIVTVCLLPAIAASTLMAAYSYAIPMTLALIVFARWPYELWREISWLQERLLAAQSASKKEPDWSLPEIQSIDWWGLVRAGFTSIEKTRAITDSTMKLKGKPWRVLQRGQYQYPVILVRCDSERRLAELKRGKLRYQQLARLVAYSYLLTLQERTRSNWAIVLISGTDEGIAVPIVEETFEYFRWGLKAARDLILQKNDNPHIDPGQPKTGQPCLGCRFGAPKVYSIRDASDPSQQPFLTRGKDGKKYHSPCGDRFGFVPPHLESNERGLLG